MLDTDNLKILNEILKEINIIITNVHEHLSENFYFFMRNNETELKNNHINISKILGYYKELGMYYGIYYNLKKHWKGSHKVLWPDPIAVSSDTAHEN